VNDLELSSMQLRQLATESKKESISLYLPTHTAGPAIRQDQLRFKKLLSRANLELQEMGFSPERTEALLKPASDLLTQSLFWRHQRQGLTVLLTPGIFQTYHLPYQCKELVVVSNDFHLKPLIPLIHGDDRYYVLAISQGNVRLFAGRRYDFEEIEIKGKPAGMREALRLDFLEKHLQYHTSTRNAPGQSVRPRFHGQGAGGNHRAGNLLRYFRQVDARVKELLPADQKAPLLLACVDYLASIYREANSYQNLLVESLSGNPDRLSLKSLQRKTREIVTPHILIGKQQDVKKYQQLAARNDKATTTDLEEIVQAAWHGRASVLFVALEECHWGSFDPERNLFTRHRRRAPGDRDLLNYAAIQTLQHGGIVYAEERRNIPADSPAAAILRYPVRMQLP
jgi:hypothetical protein